MRLLKDRIEPGVRVLFVGINPGIRSAAIGHHFAGYSNRFWKLLYESRLVPEPIATEDDRRLPEWGFGITNLVPRPTPASTHYVRGNSWTACAGCAARCAGGVRRSWRSSA